MTEKPETLTEPSDEECNRIARVVWKSKMNGVRLRSIKRFDRELIRAAFRLGQQDKVRAVEEARREIRCCDLLECPTHGFPPGEKEGEE